jgi:transposase InsO family protein
LTTSVHEAENLSLERIAAFLQASEEIHFLGENRQQVYAWIEQVLRQQQYVQQGRKARGLVRRYVEKMTGLSRAQVTRLIARYQASSTVQVASYRRHRFAQRYTRADIELLAAVDEAHGTLSGPATRRILEREYQHYGKPEYQQLATISVAHLYNLRRQPRYRERRLTYHKTRPTTVSIAERRRPDPQGQPGYLRVDTVHQGDQNSAKGVYHINAVDEVTQWQIVAASERISEAWLEPVLAALLRQFPFRIRGFHSDNGSEFINQTVARLLNKLLIEQTKSRPRHSNDNGLVESKNGAIIRKHMGYGYIAGEHAQAIHRFYAEHLNPYLNYHRPCAQADIEVDAKGRQRRFYRRYQTPIETLLKLPHPAQYLRQGLTIATLQRIAAVRSDTEAAQQMQHAKRQLFEQFRPAALGRWK